MPWAEALMRGRIGIEVAARGARGCPAGARAAPILTQFHLDSQSASETHASRLGGLGKRRRTAAPSPMNEIDPQTCHARGYCRTRGWKSGLLHGLWGPPARLGEIGPSLGCHLRGLLSGRVALRTQAPQGL